MSKLERTSQKMRLALYSICDVFFIMISNLKCCTLDRKTFTQATKQLERLTIKNDESLLDLNMLKVCHPEHNVTNKSFSFVSSME